MTPPAVGRVAPRDPATAAMPTATVAKWMVGLRLVAVSALLVGALLVQSTTDEILPITPLVRIAGLTYLLSLIWIGLWIVRTPPALNGALQLVGDLVIVATLVYLTGGVWSPFPFLFLVVVGIAALMFGLRGALGFAGAAFLVYAAMVAALAVGVLPPPPVALSTPRIGGSALLFQLFVTGTGFGVVALLTSYLAHSLQLAESRLRGATTTSARLLALSADVVRSVDSGVLAAELDGTVMLSNPAADRLLGAGRTVAGRPLAGLLVLEGTGWPEVMDAIGSGVPIRLEGSTVATSAPVGCTISPLMDPGQAPLGLVVHFRDLTEAREAARRERLRERLAAVGEMSAAIAHEIRNPLASISGSAQVLGGSPSLRQNERRLLRIVVEESRRLSTIIEAFLNYARPPALNRAECDIAATLADTLDLFANSPEVTADHVVSRAITAPETPLQADEGQLRQAFFNLARNAIQAMPQGGTMHVEAGPEGDRYVIRWSDQGVGMEPQQAEQVFQPFKAFRSGGTGLGLAVVYSIVTGHGGDIEVQSTPGEGSVFILRLPLEAT